MFKYYVKRTIRKIIAIPFFIIFTIVNLIAKPMSAILRFISPSVAIATLGIAGITFFNGGDLFITILSIILSILFTSLYIISPHMPTFVNNKYIKLKKIVFYPIVIRPPVRFTV